MTILDPLHPLQNTIVEILASQPDQTVAPLHEAVKRQGIDVSLQNLYRAVSQMID